MLDGLRGFALLAAVLLGGCATAQQQNGNPAPRQVAKTSRAPFVRGWFDLEIKAAESNAICHPLPVGSAENCREVDAFQREIHDKGLEFAAKGCGILLGLAPIEVLEMFGRPDSDETGICGGQNRPEFRCRTWKWKWATGLQGGMMLVLFEAREDPAKRWALNSCAYCDEKGCVGLPMKL